MRKRDEKMYKIAVGSSDGRNVDLKFGQADRFHVFQVDGKEVKLLGVREVKEDAGPETDAGTARAAEETDKAAADPKKFLGRSPLSKTAGAWSVRKSDFRHRSSSRRKPFPSSMCR